MVLSKRLLFIGLKAPEPLLLQQGSQHVPFIHVVPITDPEESTQIQRLCRAHLTYTHLLFTSKTAVHFFLKQFSSLPSQLPQLYSVGKATTHLLQTLGFPVAYTSHEETAEGVVALLQETMPDFAHLFWPHSEQARPVMSHYLATAPFRSTTCVLYRTLPLRPDPLPDLTACDGVVFTSPSTVHSFFACYGQVPKHLTCFAIGPITAAALHDYGFASVLWERGSAGEEGR